MKRIHAQAYPAECRGNWPILPGGWQPIPGLDAPGVPFRKIARRTGLTLGIVRQIVHGT